MSIRFELAKPIVASAAKAFTSHYDPNKPSLKLIFRDCWDDYLSYASKNSIPVRDIEKLEVERLIKCGSIDMGFEIYECPNCHRHHIICYTCKSRFCPSCGIKMTLDRAFRIANSTLDVNHRHIVFTIDHRLRGFFKSYPHTLRFLFDAAWMTLSYTMGKSYSRKNDPFIPGAIMTIHTFGRDLKWNPHVHCLVTEGGMYNSHVYKAIDFINYKSMRMSFMKCILDLMRDSLAPDSDEYKAFIKLRSELYRSDKNGFYVNGPPRKMKSTSAKKQVVQYMIRYAGRPAMAQSRISSYDFKQKTVTYWYEDHKTNERITVTESTNDFIRKLVQHIPERQFKMVRYFGLYASCEHVHKSVVKLKISHQRNSSSFIPRPVSYRERLIDTFHVDPFLCTCGHYMQFVDSCVPSRLMAGDEPPP